MPNCISYKPIHLCLTRSDAWEMSKYSGLPTNKTIRHHEFFVLILCLGQTE